MAGRQAIPRTNGRSNSAAGTGLVEQEALRHLAALAQEGLLSAFPPSATDSPRAARHHDDRFGDGGGGRRCVDLVDEGLVDLGSSSGNSAQVAQGTNSRFPKSSPSPEAEVAQRLENDLGIGLVHHRQLCQLQGTGRRRNRITDDPAHRLDVAKAAGTAAARR